MAEDEKGVLEIEGVYFEEDRTKRGKHWLWLKVRSDFNYAVEVRVRLVKHDGKSALLGGANGCAVEELSLGFHAIQKGTNELPPLPLNIQMEEKKPLMVNILVKSIRDPLVFDEVSEPAFFTPYLISMKKFTTPAKNKLN